jgi:hypothetical protein
MSAWGSLGKIGERGAGLARAGCPPHERGLPRGSGAPWALLERWGRVMHIGPLGAMKVLATGLGSFEDDFYTMTSRSWQRFD